MRFGHLLLMVMVAASSVARGQEEDDDPKAKPPAVQKHASEKARPKAEPARSDKAQAEPKALPKPPAEPKAPPESPAPKAKAVQSEKSKAEPRKAAIDGDEAPAKKPLDETTAKKAEKAKPLPKLARASEPVLEPPLSPSNIEATPAARSVRVRLVDGSTVVGSVRAEQADALVVDCSLGQLSIPRARISTIAYDAAAGVGSKRAPVQQLDDDVPAPKKRATAP